MSSPAADRRAASNKKTPLEKLDELAGPWPEEVANNAAVLKQPLDALELRTIWAMCSSPTAVKKLDYEDLIDRVNGHDNLSSRTIQFAYLANPAVPKAQRWKNMQGVTADDLELFRIRLKVLPEPDPMISIIVRAQLAWQGKGPLLSDAELTSLGKHKSLSWLFARQYNCPAARLVKLFDDEPVAFINPNFPVDVLVELSRSDDAVMRSNVAGASRLPLEQVAELARDPDQWVRVSVARRRDLPKALQTLLRKDGVESVREAVDEPRQPDPIHPIVRPLDETAVARALKSSKPKVRHELLKNPYLTVAQRAPLENDPDDGVRITWRDTTTTEPELLRAVAAIPDADLAEFVFSHSLTRSVPTVAAAIARRRDKDSDEVMRETLDLPAEAWRVMLYS